MTEQEIIKEFIKMEQLDKILIFYYVIAGNLGCLNMFKYPQQVKTINNFIEQFLKINKLGKTDFVVDDVCKNNKIYTLELAIQNIREMVSKGMAMAELLFYQNRSKK